MIRRFLATKPKFGSSAAPPTVPVKGFKMVLAGTNYRNSRKICRDPFGPEFLNSKFFIF